METENNKKLKNFLKKYPENTVNNPKKTKKRIIYNPSKKKKDYNSRDNKEQFLEQFLDDITFLKMYKKINTAQRKQIRQYRKRHNLESVYSKVEMQYKK